ncbi:MAG: 16S rRNA (uracil(1498)-N(3))-methyltransferase [Verrucomicrobiae bacterium]
MHRFHLPAETWESAILSPEESHHCVNVLRMDAAGHVTVFDGAGREARAKILKADAKAVALKLSQATKSPPPPCAITLAQAVPKGKNMDLIVQKAVELGASAVAPILSGRTVVQLDAAELEKKRAKWQETALEACKQCGQNHLPHVASPCPPKEFFERSDRSELILIASLQPDARPIKSVIADFVAAHSRLPRSATVLIGPEGDFTPAEIALAKSCGCLPVTLGPIILRTETAAIYCLSVLAHELFQPATP